MRLTLKEIDNLLKDLFETIELIESESASKARFNESGVVLFKSTYKNKRVALKCFIDIENENNLSKAKKEYNYITGFADVNGVVNAYELIALTDDIDTTFGYIIVEEYFPETLGQFIKKGKLTSHKFLMSFLEQMDRTLIKLHFNNKKPIIHCDIKPSNIGIRNQNNHIEFVLFDFDIAIESNGDREVSFSKLLGLTPEYSAPEILNGINNQYNINNIISNKADIYSVGVIALQLARNKSFIQQGDIENECRQLPLKLQHIIYPLITKNQSERSAVLLNQQETGNLIDFIDKNKLLVLTLLSLVPILLGLLLILLLATMTW